MLDKSLYSHWIGVTSIIYNGLICTYIRPDSIKIARPSYCMYLLEEGIPVTVDSQYEPVKFAMQKSLASN